MRLLNLGISIEKPCMMLGWGEIKWSSAQPTSKLWESSKDNLSVIELYNHGYRWHYI